MSELHTAPGPQPSTGEPPSSNGLGGRSPLAWDPTLGRAARVFGVSPDAAWVEVDDRCLTARFGPWVTTTERANIVSAEITGPDR